MSKTKAKASRKKTSKAKAPAAHEEPISKPALQLIDKAAALLKKAILKSEEQT